MCEQNDVVYDLEIADNHNYFAEGVLVSNCHGFAQYQAARTRTLLGPDGLASRARHAWLLSGTPIVNSAADLYPLVFGALGSQIDWFDFCSHYAVMKDTGFNGMKPIGIRNTDELAAGLRPHVLRRTIQSLGIELPPLTITRQILPLDPGAVAQIMAGLEKWTPQRLTNALEENDELRDSDMARVRRALGIAKVPAVVAHLDTIAAAGEGPIVVFFQHTDVRVALHAALRQAGAICSWIDGKVTAVQLRAAREWFQAGKLDVLLVQTQAGGQGLTLHRGHRAVVAELPWTSSALFQAIKRIHRIGQTKACLAETLSAPNCWLDDVLATVVAVKQRASDNLMSLLTSSS